MLMQLFSFSGFAVNSPHDDTQSTAGVSCGTNMSTSGQKHQYCEYWTHENPAPPDAGGT